MRYPWYVRLLFWFQRRKYGTELNSAKLWAQSPQVFLALSALYGRLNRQDSPLEPTLRSLILVRISQLNGCHFCVDLNTSVLLEYGISIEKAEAIAVYETSDLFSSAEKLALDYAAAVTDSSTPMDADLRAKVKSTFGEEGLIELTALSAFQNMSTKFNNAFDLAPQGFCALKKD